MSNPGQQAVCQSTDGRVARNENTQRRVGAPPKVYLLASWAALALCVAASATFFYFALKEPDGHFSLDMLTRWEKMHPVCAGLVSLLLAAVQVAALDVMVWEAASWLARLRHKGSVTVRKVASLRFGLQVAFAAVMVLLFRLFPAAFPQPKGGTAYLALAMLAVPILLAAIYWIRAAQGPVGTQRS